MHVVVNNARFLVLPWVCYAKLASKILGLTARQLAGDWHQVDQSGVGVLIQCKSSSIQEQALGWDAVKEVVAGAAAYEMWHAGVVFQKVAVTNQFFNGSAKEQAHLNHVGLIDRHAPEDMLEKYPVCRSLIV